MAVTFKYHAKVENGVTYSAEYVLTSDSFIDGPYAQKALEMVFRASFPLGSDTKVVCENPCRVSKDRDDLIPQPSRRFG